MGRHESFDPTNAIPFSLGTMGEALPAPGSPEALEAFGAACRAVDAASRLSDADMEALHIAPGASLWTSDKATDALSGNFSRFMPNEIEAARATPRARLAELQILALRRELRMAEAAHSSRIRELHALVYGDEPDPTDEDQAPPAGEPDPMFALIEANRTAEAAIDTFGRETRTQPDIDPSGDVERALSDAQMNSWGAVYRTRPTTLAGLAGLRNWIAWQIERHKEPPEGDGSVWADAYLSLHAALDLVLKPAEADPRLVAMVAEWQDVRRKLDDPATLGDPEADALADAHSVRQRKIYLYPARTPLDLLAKVPALRDELEDAMRGADGGTVTNDLPISAWTGLLADIERIAGAAPVPAASDDDAELIALAEPWEAAHRVYEQRSAEQTEVERIAETTAGWPGPAPEGSGAAFKEWRNRADEYRKQTGIDDAEAETNDALDDLAEIEDRVAAMQAHTLAGLRLKARIAERNSSIDVEWPQGLGDGMVRDLLAITGGPSGLTIPPEA